MIDRLIDDMNKALDADAYMAALAIALILPDMCGKAEYPQYCKRKDSKKRYIKWFDEYLGQYNKHINEDGEKTPYLSGEIIYQLRCAYLHSGTPDIDSEDIKEEINKLDQFILILAPKNDAEIYADLSIKKEYWLNIRKFCGDLELAVKAYYQDNKTKLNFSNLQIIDKIG